MKALVIIFFVSISSFMFSQTSQMGRYSARIDRSSNNIDYLHKVALDKLTRIITSTDGRRKREIKISIPKADRLAAIKKLGKLKNEKSIKVLTFLCIEGVFTTYSPQRGAEGGESALTRESTDIRLNSYKSLLNYDKTAMSEDNKKITVYTILNSIRHEREDAVTYYALSAAEKFSVFFNDSAKIFVNSLFSKQARNLVVKRKFRIIYLAIRVSKALKHKSGVEFLDKLLLSGITGRLYTYALKAKAQLKAGN